MPLDVATLRQRQALPLEEKVKMTLEKIETWYEYWEGQVYVAFSGGKDSTVLLDLVRSRYPEVPGMFADTGLEYPEIRDFVKTFDNIEWVKPTMTFKKVLGRYGYPVVSKEICMAINRFKTGKDQQTKAYRLMGAGKKRSGTVGRKWRFLINAPFKVSGECCKVMKKYPGKMYGKRTGRYPMLGMMAENSRYREQVYTQYGCHMTGLKQPKSWPLAFWTERDVWLYLKKNDVPHCKIYEMGWDRTGCMFCMFGVHLEGSPNRFQRMALTHPKRYKFCLDKLGLREVLSYMGIPYKPFEQTTLEVGL